MVLCRSRIDGCIYAVKKGIRTFHGEMDRCVPFRAGPTRAPKSQPPLFTALHGMPGSRSLRAFREAQALTAAGPSPLLVACHGAWMEGELYYAKMEFCAGGSLGAALRRGASPASVSFHATAGEAPGVDAPGSAAAGLSGPTPTRQRPHVSRVAELAGVDPVRGRLFGGPGDVPGPLPTASPTAHGPTTALQPRTHGMVEPAVLTVVAQTALVRAGARGREGPLAVTV